MEMSVCRAAAGMDYETSGSHQPTHRDAMVNAREKRQPNQSSDRGRYVVDVCLFCRIQYSGYADRI
jgi:hypothetical protein